MLLIDKASDACDLRLFLKGRVTAVAPFTMTFLTDLGGLGANRPSPIFDDEEGNHDNSTSHHHCEQLLTGWIWGPGVTQWETVTR